MLRFKDLMERLNIAKTKMDDIVEERIDLEEGSYKDGDTRMGSVGPITTDAERAERAKKYREKMLKKEEVEQIDELSPATKASYMKKAAAEIDKHWDKSKTDARSAYKYYGRKNTMRKIANEEVEQIDELSSDTLKNYREKAKKQGVGIQNKMKIGGGDWSKDGQDTKTLRKRASGHNTAGKILRKRGETHVHAEELELEEGRMKELSMDMETMNDKEFKAKHKKSKGDMQKSLKSEELKGSQHKIDANKNGKIDGHDFKILRNAKKARYQ